MQPTRQQIAETGKLWRKPPRIKHHLFSNEMAPLIFEDPKATLFAIQSYFEWCESEQLKSEQIELYRGEWRRGTINHMRAFTLQGCCAFIGVSSRTWNKWLNGEDSLKMHPDGTTMGDAQRALVEAIQAILEWAMDIMYEQKFTGAAAGLLNGNLITRELKISDKVETVNQTDSTLSANIKADADSFTEALLALRKRSAD